MYRTIYMVNLQVFGIVQFWGVWVLSKILTYKKIGNPKPLPLILLTSHVMITHTLDIYQIPVFPAIAI